MHNCNQRIAERVGQRIWRDVSAVAGNPFHNPLQANQIGNLPSPVPEVSNGRPAVSGPLEGSFFLRFRECSSICLLSCHSEGMVCGRSSAERVMKRYWSFHAVTHRVPCLAGAADDCPACEISPPARGFQTACGNTEAAANRYQESESTNQESLQTKAL